MAISQSRAGSHADLSGLTYTLDNGVPANLLGDLGSGISYAGDNTFLALPDRGPNAVNDNSAVDDTVGYVNRFHTVRMRIEPNTSGTGLPLTVTPVLSSTTLLWDESQLIYGNGSGVGLGSGAPHGSRVGGSGIGKGAGNCFVPTARIILPAHSFPSRRSPMVGMYGRDESCGLLSFWEGTRSTSVTCLKVGIRFFE